MRPTLEDQDGPKPSGHIRAPEYI
eukprot:COSAG02_NODE_35875_length_462_cov_0.848485_2_plen_23_part_01